MFKKFGSEFVVVFGFGILMVASLSPAAAPRSIKDSEIRLGMSLVGGVEDAGEMFPSVLVFSTDDKQLDSRCTGTKVGQKFVLTAAHCFIEETAQKVSHLKKHEKSDFYFSFDSRVSKPGNIKLGRVSRVLFPPELVKCFDGSGSQVTECIEETADIAVVELNESPDFSLAPISPIDTVRVNVGEFITVVGFGNQSDKDESAPVRKYHSFKVASPQELESAFKLFGITEASVNFELYFGALGALVGKEYANLGSGDSGGPVFRINSGVASVVGVNAFTFCPDKNEDCELTSNSFFNRIHSGGPYHLGDWLTSVLK